MVDVIDERTRQIIELGARIKKMQDTTDERVADVRKRADQIHARIDELNSSIDELRARIREHEAEVQTRETEIAAFAVEIDRIETGADVAELATHIRTFAVAPDSPNHAIRQGSIWYPKAYRAVKYDRLRVDQVVDPKICSVSYLRANGSVIKTKAVSIESVLNGHEDSREKAHTHVRPDHRQKCRKCSEDQGNDVSLLDIEIARILASHGPMLKPKEIRDYMCLRSVLDIDSMPDGAVAGTLRTHPYFEPSDKGAYELSDEGIDMIAAHDEHREDLRTYDDALVRWLDGHEPLGRNLAKIMTPTIVETNVGSYLIFAECCRAGNQVWSSWAEGHGSCFMLTRQHGSGSDLTQAMTCEAQDGILITSSLKVDDKVTIVAYHKVEGATVVEITQLEHAALKAVKGQKTPTDTQNLN